MFPDTGIAHLLDAVSTILVPTGKNTDVVLHKGNVVKAGQRIAETDSGEIQGSNQSLSKWGTMNFL